MTDQMKYFRLVVVICLALLMVFPSMAEAKKKPRKKTGPYQVSAASALLYDESGWNKYYARAVDRKIFPASTTKVMTALLVLEHLDLDTVVVIGRNATTVLPSKVDLKEGEKYHVRDLLYAALLNSANDAAAALAEAVAGSQDKFVEMMNARALQLGAKNTLFANPHGLPSSSAQYSTAYDMFLIFRAALKKDFFREAIKIRTMTVESVDGRKIALKSHNKSLFKKWQQSVYGKTGYTQAAQACFIGVVNKGKQDLIVAVFGCPGSTRWDDVKYIIEHYGGVAL
ncbi:MAG: D-alanyl-D-alanine carboxypeptidase [Candidatus Omnitrophica bacterium]|nr:D-alanyl-D-alanine carboxypeptidase [Candidatus Omnitrophota bacterium]